METNNFINDSKFAEAFIADKINLSNIGPNKIKKELLEHNIDELTIDEYLSKYDNDVFEEKIIKLIDKKSMNPKNSNYVLKNKITNYLIDLGYDLNMIKENIDKVNFNSKIALEKDYNKLFKKLALKFNGDELIKQIKSKLYQKGYSLDEINQFLDEVTN